MRKFILLSLVCLSTEIFAQKSFFGVDAGINVANQREHVIEESPFGVSGGPPQDFTYFFKNSILPTFGFFYQHGVNEKIGVRLNLQLAALGCKGGQTGQYYTVIPPSDPTIVYLTLPLTCHYSINKHLAVNAGPYLSFTLDAPKSSNQPGINLYHKNDHGFSFGAEHDLHKNLAIGINYVVGLKNIWLNDTNNYYNLQTKITNRALQFTLIYKFKKPS